MKKIKKNINLPDDELLSEYDIDYSKVKRNPYFKKNKTTVELDSEVVDFFQSPKQINDILHAIIKSLPTKTETI